MVHLVCRKREFNSVKTTSAFRKNGRGALSRVKENTFGSSMSIWSRCTGTHCLGRPEKCCDVEEKALKLCIFFRVLLLCANVSRDDILSVVLQKKCLSKAETFRRKISKEEESKLFPTGNSENNIFEVLLLISIVKTGKSMSPKVLNFPIWSQWFSDWSQLSNWWFLHPPSVRPESVVYCYRENALLLRFQLLDVSDLNK